MKLLVLPGDGIGPEITRATLAVLDAADRRFKLNLTFEQQEIGFAALEKYGTTLPDGVLERAREVDGVLLGPISHLDYPPRDKGGVNVAPRGRWEKKKTGDRGAQGQRVPRYRRAVSQDHARSGAGVS